MGGPGSPPALVNRSLTIYPEGVGFLQPLDGHHMTLVECGNPAYVNGVKWHIECECGYVSRNVRVQRFALGAAAGHLEKKRQELRRQGLIEPDLSDPKIRAEMRRNGVKPEASAKPSQGESKVPPGSRVAPRQTA